MKRLFWLFICLLITVILINSQPWRGSLSGPAGNVLLSRSSDLGSDLLPPLLGQVPASNTSPSSLSSKEGFQSRPFQRADTHVKSRQLSLSDLGEFGTIVWSTNRDGNYEIYRMRADGTDQVRLTYDAASDYHPVWSKDGQWVYFCRIEAGGKEDIYRMRPDGTSAQLVLEDASPFFDISYDSLKIVYLPKEQESLSIRLYDIESGTSEEIIPAVAPEYANKLLAYPTISPDGNWLAFASDYPDILAVQLSTLDGATRYFYDYGCQAQYRPNGELIVWVINVVHDLYVGRADGGSNWLFENSIPGRPHCYFPRWSNDGEYIIFGASPFFDWESDYDLYIKAFEGGEAIRLTSDPASDTWPDLYIASHTLSLSAQPGGTTEPEPGTYEYGVGREVSITAIPEEGRSFSHWSGDASGTTNPLTVNMDEDKSITAHFVQQDQSFLEMDSSAMSFAALQGEVKTQVLKLRNGGAGALTWTLNSNVTWLSGNPQSGESSGEWDEIVVSVNASPLEAGVYNGTITITSPEAANSPQTVQVNLKVTVSLPVIQLDRDSLAFTTSNGQGNPSDQTFQIRNSGGGSLVYNIISDSGWLTVTPVQGISDGEWDMITVSADISGLQARDYSGTLTVASTTATNSPQQVSVSLSSDVFPPVIKLDRESLSFAAVYGEGNPASQAFQVRNSGGRSMTYALSSDSGWLSVFPNQGDSEGEWDTINVSVNISGLEPGEYSGKVFIAASSATNTPQSVTINLRVNLPPYPFQPLDLRLERIGHLGLFVKRFINQLTWKNHPRNSGNYTVIKYKIYRKKRNQGDGHFVPIAEVRGDGVLIFSDEFATQEERDLYTYGVTAIDDLGRESKRTKVSGSPG